VDAQYSKREGSVTFGDAEVGRVVILVPEGDLVYSHGYQTRMRDE